jgi:probable HAF family extracellular repeat protein
METDSGIRGFNWENDVLTELSTPFTDPRSWAYDINSSGYIAGKIVDNSNTHRAVLWNPDLTIGPMIGSNSAAHAINDNNQVVGLYDNNKAFLWEDGIITNLGVLPGGDYTRANDINNKGQVVGRSHANGTTDHAFLWDNGTMIDLETYSGAYGSSRANAINNNGEIVGWLTGEKAALWKDGVTYDLNSLIFGATEWQLHEAWDINDKGQIVGKMEYNDQAHAFLLTPIPIPGAVWLLGTGLIALAGLRRKLKKN